jgi:hypothetical protein
MRSWPRLSSSLVDLLTCNNKKPEALIQQASEQSFSLRSNAIDVRRVGADGEVRIEETVEVPTEDVADVFLVKSSMNKMSVEFGEASGNKLGITRKASCNLDHPGGSDCV